MLWGIVKIDFFNKLGPIPMLDIWYCIYINKTLEILWDFVWIFWIFIESISDINDSNEIHSFELPITVTSHDHWHLGAESKWLPFCRWLIPIHFHESKFVFFINILHKLFSKGPN